MGLKGLVGLMGLKGLVGLMGLMRLKDDFKHFKICSGHKLDLNAKH